VAHRRKKLEIGSCFDVQFLSCQFCGIVFTANCHKSALPHFGDHRCAKLTVCGKYVDRKFRQFAKNGVRMVAVMNELDVYIATSQKCIYDGLKLLLGSKILIRLYLDLFGPDP
jgi:hypothetical protein